NTLTQMGYAIGLVLSFTTASLGFLLTLIKDKDFNPGSQGRLSLRISLVLLVFSIILGLLCVINRLRDFRKTKDIAKEREDLESTNTPKAEIDGKLKNRREEVRKLGERTWVLFYIE